MLLSFLSLWQEKLTDFRGRGIAAGVKEQWGRGKRLLLLIPEKPLALLQAEGWLREGERKPEHNFYHLWCMRLSLVWRLTLIFWGLKLEIPFFILTPAASNNSESLWKQEKNWVKFPGLSIDSSVLILMSAHLPGSTLTVPFPESSQCLEQSLHAVSKTPLAPNNCWRPCSSEWFKLSQLHLWASFLVHEPRPSV